MNLCSLFWFWVFSCLLPLTSLTFSGLESSADHSIAFLKRLAILWCSVCWICSGCWNKPFSAPMTHRKLAPWCYLQLPALHSWLCKALAELLGVPLASALSRFWAQHHLIQSRLFCKAGCSNSPSSAVTSEVHCLSPSLWFCPSRTLSHTAQAVTRVGPFFTCLLILMQRALRLGQQT